MERERIETEIGLLHETLVRRVSQLCLQTTVIPNNTQSTCNNYISNTARVNESFTAFRAQIEDLKLRHCSNMTSRVEIRNQIVTLQHRIRKKVTTAVLSTFSSDNISQERTLQVSREIENFRTVEDVDAHIKPV